MARIQSAHGKTRVDTFTENVRATTGLSIQVLDGPGGSRAASEWSLASVRNAEIETKSIGLKSDMTVSDAERLFSKGLGLSIELLARDGTRPAGQTNLGTIGLSETDEQPSERSSHSDGSSVLSITGQKKISTLQREFTEHHSHLGLMLFPSSEHEKSLRGEFIRPLSGELTIAAVREKKSTEELSIHGNMLVRNLESGIREVYGLYAQVCIMNDNGTRGYTGEAHDSFTLTELNRRQQDKGRSAFTY